MDRRFPVSPFDPQRFEPFFGKEARELEVELLSGGACNSNYLVTRKNGDRCVCRVHSRGTPTAERYITRLAGEFVPAVEYLWVGDGVSVMGYIDGDHFRPTPQLLRHAGRLIATMANIEFDRAGDIKSDGRVAAFEGWDSCERGLLAMLADDNVADLLSGETRERLEAIIRANRAMLERFDRSRNLVHGDFRPDNILVRGDSIVGLLDWEFAHSGSSFMDIGNLLRHFSREHEADLAAGLMEGGFDLPGDWRFRAYLIDLASHLEFLTSNRSPEFKRECVERIENLIKISNAQQAGSPDSG